MLYYIRELINYFNLKNNTLYVRGFSLKLNYKNDMCHQHNITQYYIIVIK